MSEPPATSGGKRHAKAGADAVIDPKGLIHDAFEIVGISGEECRSIFLDWALSLPEDTDTATAIRRLLNRHGGAPADHPMHVILSDGLSQSETPRRRGGWRARPRAKG